MDEIWIKYGFMHKKTAPTTYEQNWYLSDMGWKYGGHYVPHLINSGNDSFSH